VIPDGYEYGYPPNEGTVMCIRREGSRRFLCGLRKAFVPAVQPTDPATVHGQCLAVLAKNPPQPAPGRAVCPLCGGDAPVVADRIQSHGRVIVDADGAPQVTADVCLGVNLRVRAG
jgi:hypothetical protein